MMRFKCYLLLCALLLISWSASAQYKVRGIVKDAHSKEIIPFATLQFVGTNTGMVSNEEGIFEFELNYIPSDSLLVRVMGYVRTVLYVDKNKKEQHLDFEIMRSDIGLQEFEIKSTANFALILLRKIIRNKPIHNVDRFQNYKYELYNKLELDLKDVNIKKLANNRFTKPFAFILQNIDTTTDEHPFLPVFLTETISDYYRQTQPIRTREFIKASRTSGVDNESVTRFLGGMYQNINVYDNYIPVLDKEFISPISNQAANFYRYTISDTQYIAQRRYIKMNFEPRRKGENVFRGELWVQDSSFAIYKMSMSVPKDANINFVRRISLTQEFNVLGDSATWFLSKDKFIADFWVPSPEPGKSIDFIGRKTTTYDHILINDSSVSTLLADYKAGQHIILQDSARQRDESFWAQNRHEALSKNELAIYKMVDTIQNMPIFKRYFNTVSFITTGYKKTGPIEWGPYYYLFSYNRLEGFRLRLDLGSTPAFHKDLYLNGYLAYGFKDDRFKGKLAGLWLLDRKPRMYVYGSFTRDLDQGVNYYDEVGMDNIFSVAIRKPDIPQKFMQVEEKRAEFFKEYFSGFSHHFSLVHKQYLPYEPLPTKDLYPAPQPGLDPLTTMEAAVRLRFAYREEFIEANYYRLSLGSKYPIAELRLGMGMKGILKSAYSYQRVGFTVSDDVKISPFGKLYFNLFGGKIFSSPLPFTMLEIHPGNEIYYYNKYAFNMMNRYEFLSDQYAGFNLEHTIGSGIFNYIPFIKKLKFRQFWTAKGIIGKLSESNTAFNLQHGYPFKSLQGNPYLEVGTGVENIIRFLRVDFVWRVAPKPLPTEPSYRKFGVFGSFKLQF